MGGVPGVGGVGGVGRGAGNQGVVGVVPAGVGVGGDNAPLNRRMNAIKQNHPKEAMGKIGNDSIINYIPM